MNSLTKWSEIFLSALQELGSKVIAGLSHLLVVAIIILLGWLIAKAIYKGVWRILTAIKFDEIAEKVKVSEILNKAGIDSTPSKLIAKMVYWMLWLLIFMTASEALGWQVFSNELSKLLNYLPTLFSAIILFIVGSYIAGFIRDIIRGATASLGIGTGKFISNFVFYLFFIVITLTALEQAGVDTSIITSNLLLIIGSIFIAGAISYGFASRVLLSNILASFFSRKQFSEGQIIEVEDVRGEIIAINNISVTVKTEEADVIVPTNLLITNKVKIIKNNKD